MSERSQEDPSPRMASTAPTASTAPALPPDQAVFATRHTFVATVAVEGRPAAVAAIQGLPPGAAVAEVRLDPLWPAPPDPGEAADDLEALLAAAEGRTVLLATLRPVRQGGRFDGPEAVRLGLLVAAARAGFRAVDVEADLQDPRPVLRQARAAGAGVVLSDHRLPGAPARDVGLRHLVAMQDLRADVQKLAFPAAAFPDTMRALELAHAHAAHGGRPAVQPLGFGGAALRVLLAVAGNRATYGHAPGAGPAVPGQPAVEDLLRIWRHWGLDAAPPAHGGGHAPWYAVLGRPTAHSLSPCIHNAAFHAAGRPERFGALDVPDSAGAFRLLSLVASRIGLAGASVTAPHKLRAADVAEGDATVRAVGAANCLRFTPTGAHATNTDATAFRALLEDAGARSVAVLGSGGAARAALWAARELALEASFSSRDPERAAPVAEAFRARWFPWTERAAMDADAWVQATPPGRGHGADDAPLPDGRLTPRSTLVELVYGDEPTAAEEQARRAGCRIVDGRAFLVEQAVHAFAFWTGTPPDRDAMAVACRPARRGARSRGAG